MIAITTKPHKETKSKKQENKNKNINSNIDEEKQELIKNIEEKNDLLLRLQAEFANFKRRTQQQQESAYTQGVADTLKTFVDVFDDFELALQNESHNDEFKKGMEMIFAKFISAAEEKGLKKIPTTGEQFDPHKHEALLTQESEEPEQVILEELQAGYQLNDNILRTAKVKVSKQQNK